jgi:hypothetical protein
MSNDDLYIKLSAPCGIEILNPIAATIDQYYAVIGKLEDLDSDHVLPVKERLETVVFEVVNFCFNYVNDHYPGQVAGVPNVFTFD